MQVVDQQSEVGDGSLVSCQYRDSAQQCVPQEQALVMQQIVIVDALILIVSFKFLTR